LEEFLLERSEGIGGERGERSEDGTVEHGKLGKLRVVTWLH